MTVEEIQAKLPEARVYSLTKDAAYIIMCDRSMVTRVMADSIVQELDKQGISAMSILTDVPKEAIRILKL